MNRFVKALYSKNTIYAVSAVWALIWLFGLHNRFIEADECVLGEYSYHFLHEGVVRLKLIPEILTWENRLYSHHRFFTWYGSIVIWIFGWSITALKASILPFYALFFFILYKYLHRLELKEKTILLGALLVFTSPLILLKSFSYRPDILLMADGIAVIYFLKKYRVTKSLKYALLAGVFSGLAFLTHLNGMAFCIAGFAFLLIRKEYKGLGYYVLSGAIVGGLYFLEFLEQGVFEAFIYEITHWPTINHGENYLGDGSALSIILGRVTKLLSEHQRFFWGNDVIAYSALFFFCLIFGIKYLKKNHQDVMLFLLLLVLALNIFGSHIAERYIVYYYGSMAIIITSTLAHWMNNSQNVKLIAATLIIVLQFVFAGMKVSELYSRSYPTVESHAEILGKINNENKPEILVPYELVYNQMPNYDLYSFKTYEYLGEDMEGGMMSQEQLFAKASELGMDYIIINERMANFKENWFYNWKIEPNPHYKKFFENDRYIILKKDSTN